MRRAGAGQEAASGSTERIFVICPAQVVTGGAELLHQLVDLLRSRGRDASLIYRPFADGHSVPADYRSYNVRIGHLHEITADSIVVVPEVYAWELRRLPKCRLYFWWLSVDNFRKAAAGTRARHILPKTWLERLALSVVRRRASAHLHQSEYARTYATAHRLSPLLPLSDYLSPAYIEAARTNAKSPRDNLVVYNPAKGFERTKLILEDLAKSSPMPIEAVAIKGMTRDQVMATLRRAKLYIDFGEHPGKDRLPREAAALGCCVVVNRRGSAANDLDVPLPSKYKVNDRQPGYAALAAELIIEICTNFEDHEPRFAAYRSAIAAEPEVFASQAAELFGSSALRRELELSEAGEMGG